MYLRVRAFLLGVNRCKVPALFDVHLKRALFVVIVQAKHDVTGHGYLAIHPVSCITIVAVQALPAHLWKTETELVSARVNVRLS